MEEILHQLIGSLSHFLQGFIHPKWCRISSINSTSKLPYICILVDSSQFGEFFRKSLHWLHRQNLLSIPSPFKNQGLLIRYTGSLKVAARTLIFWKIHLQLVLFVFFAACTRARASNMNCWQARISLVSSCLNWRLWRSDKPRSFECCYWRRSFLRGISVWFILPYTNNTNYLGNLLETLTWIKGIPLPNHHLRWPRLRSL